MSFPEYTDRSRSRALNQRLMQTNVEEVTSIPIHSFRSSGTTASQPPETASIPAEDRQTRVKRLEDSRLSVLRQETLGEETLFKQEEELIRDMMALYKECVTTTEEERRKRSEERKRYVSTVMKEVEKKEAVPKAPAPSFGASLANKSETVRLPTEKPASTPKPPAPSFGDAAFGGAAFGSKTENTSGVFGAKTVAAKPPAPSFSGSFGSKSGDGGVFGSKEESGSLPKPVFGTGSVFGKPENGGLFGAKPAESAPKPPAPSFGNGSFGAKETGGLFGAKPAESAPKPPAPSFGNGSFGAKETGGLFGAKPAESAPKSPAPTIGGSGLFGSTYSGLFDSEKDDSTKSAFSFGQNGKGDVPKPPSFSSSSPGLFVTKKDIPK